MSDSGGADAAECRPHHPRNRSKAATRTGGITGILTHHHRDCCVGASGRLDPKMSALECVGGRGWTAGKIVSWVYHRREGGALDARGASVLVTTTANAGCARFELGGHGEWRRIEDARRLGKQRRGARASSFYLAMNEDGRNTGTRDVLVKVFNVSLASGEGVLWQLLTVDRRHWTRPLQVMCCSCYCRARSCRNGDNVKQDAAKQRRRLLSLGHRHRHRLPGWRLLSCMVTAKSVPLGGCLSGFGGRDQAHPLPPWCISEATTAGSITCRGYRGPEFGG
jgi:hypothetical protein